MSDIQLYLLEVDKNPAEAKNVAAQSAAKLESQQLKLLDLITSLQAYINNKDNAEQRAKSMGYLAHVVAELPQKVLSGQERRLLCDFVLGRLEADLEGIGASARLLIALENLGKWDQETAQKVVQTFVDHANPLRQVKQQTERYPVAQLIDLLLAKYREAIRKLHESDPEFMTRFIAFFDGEKDPRNLMIVFSLLQVPMTEWDVHAHAQDLFESVFNYFPITFKPPPDDPYGITAQDLKDRLRDCIAANSDFAPHAFPHLLDKLDSTSMNTKRDVLNTIQACTSSYESKIINLYSVTLWDALKFEILNVQEEDLAVASLQALALIAVKLSDSEQSLNTYLRPIIKECNEHLEDAPTKQSEAAGRVLHALAASSALVADKIAKGVFPTLFSLFSNSESITRRRGLLEVFNEILNAYVELERSARNFDAEAVKAFSNDALNAMLRAFINAPKAEVSFRLTALTGLAQLATVKGVLSEADVHRVVDALTDVILHEHVEGHGDIRDRAVQTLIKMAATVPAAIRDRAIPTFMVEIPDVPTDLEAVKNVLQAFARLSAESQVFDTVVLRLKNKLNAARHQGQDVEYQRLLLLAILHAFSAGSPRQEEDHVRSDYYADFVQPFVSELRTDVQASSMFVEIVGRLCNTILRQQGPHFQATVYNQDLEWMSPVIEDSVTSERLGAFLLYYFAAIRPEVVEAEQIVALLHNQSKVALQGKPNSTNLRLISLLVDKFANPKTMEATLSICNIEVEALLSTKPSSQSIQVAFAVVKGLLIQGRSAQLITKYITLLLSLLISEEQTSTLAASLFSHLLSPDPILTKENHCLISGLYKQKLFNQLIPPLTTSLRSSSLPPHQKHTHLTALSGLLRHLPYSILQPTLSTLTAPLLQILDLPQASSAATTALTIFESLLMHDPEIIEEHTSSLVTRLLNSTSPSSSASAQPAPGKTGPPASVRAKSLQCLTLVPKQLKREKVLPYRRQVVKRLVGCLDDRKRGVRGEAVKCRGSWLGLEEEEEDEDAE